MFSPCAAAATGRLLLLPPTAARLALLAPLHHTCYSTRPVPSPLTANTRSNNRLSAGSTVGDSAVVRYRWVLGDDVCLATRRPQPQLSPLALLAAADKPGDPAEPKGGGPEKDLPTPEVLERAQQRVAKEFSDVFLKGPDLSLYVKDLVFENKSVHQIESY